jgi:predicted amidohydrolase
MKLRVAQIRIVPAKGDLAGNHARLLRALGAVARRRPDVVVTTECFLDGYVSTEKQVTRRNIAGFAIRPGSSACAREISAWAAGHRAWVVLGCTRRTRGGAANSALVFNRRGALAGVYDKVHCQAHDRKYVAGEALPVFRSDFGTFGVMICADRRWPETVRTLALRGAQVIFNPTAGMHDDLNLAMMRTRAYESEVFIAFTHPRLSLVTGPGGEVLTKERRRDRLFSITALDLAEVDRRRRRPGSHLRGRRTMAYAR